MRTGHALIVIGTLLMAAPVSAQAGDPAPSTSSERRLSPQQIEAVLAEAAKKREAGQGKLEYDALGSAPKRQVHGEVGFSVGTGGYRGAFGTAIYPLGDDGVAAISMDYIDWGKRRFQR